MILILTLRLLIRVLSLSVTDIRTLFLYVVLLRGRTSGIPSTRNSACGRNSRYVLRVFVSVAEVFKTARLIKRVLRSDTERVVGLLHLCFRNPFLMQVILLLLVLIQHLSVTPPLRSVDFITHHIIAMRLSLHLSLMISGCTLWLLLSMCLRMGRTLTLTPTA